jgi:hypothetical protein
MSCTQYFHSVWGVQLLADNHPAYVRFCRRMAARRFSLRFRDRAPLFGRLSLFLEEFLRRWMSESIDFTPCRILKYHGRRHIGRPRTYYREIDAVCGRSSDAPKCFLEIKVSDASPRRPIQRGRGQLELLGAVARVRWDSFSCGVLLASTRPNVSAVSLEDFSIEDFVLGLPRWDVGVEIPSICLSAESVWNWATGAGLVRDNDLFERAVEEARSVSTSTGFSSGHPLPSALSIAFEDVFPPGQ